jgi:hypothetical protein
LPLSARTGAESDVWDARPGFQRTTRMLRIGVPIAPQSLSHSSR